jgi:hypothetical protein
MLKAKQRTAVAIVLVAAQHTEIPNVATRVLFEFVGPQSMED